MIHESGILLIDDRSGAGECVIQHLNAVPTIENGRTPGSFYSKLARPEVTRSSQGRCNNQNLLRAFTISIAFIETLDIPNQTLLEYMPMLRVVMALVVAYVLRNQRSGHQ